MRVTYPHPSATPSDPHPVHFSASASAAGTRDRRFATVRVSGEIDAASSTEFASVLLDAGDGAPRVHLDLSAATFIDSAGIRVLARSMWDLRATGSDLILVAASPMAENILRITGILDVLKDSAP